jgi:hypothetical protein
VVRFLRNDEADTGLPRQPNGMPAADLGDPLPDPVLPVEVQADARLRDHASIGLRVHFAAYS